MNTVEFNYKKLRLAQDLNKKTLEAIGMKLMQKNKDGIFVMPDDSVILSYINNLAEKREIKHYRLQGEYEEIFLFDNDEIISDLNIMEIEAKKIPEIIPIQCYDEPITKDDEIPIEISRIHSLFKLPKTLFNSGSCIYFLCREEKVVYVGQAENVHHRLIQHIKTKEFDSVYYLRVPYHKMNIIESSLIAYLKPEYNVTGKKTRIKENLIAESILNPNSDLAV
jgi:predicted GIY-YIG superfamily endonuclease